jgi:uncharacterized cupin superfamily protein
LVDGKGRGLSAALERRGHFDQIGISLYVLGPGEPRAMYHRETDQEDLLVLSGEALLIVEGKERLLRPWDLVHCPAETKHAIVGAGDGPCVVFGVGATAIRHGAGVEEETTDAEQAYARFPEPEPMRYRDGWLPG